MAYLRQLQKERAHKEEKRLWYVAATRARRKLHLLGQIAHPDKEPEPNSLLSILFAVPQIKPRFRFLPPPPPPLETAARAGLTRASRSAADGMAMDTPKPAFSWSSCARRRRRDRSRRTLSIRASDTLRRIGTVTHAVPAPHQHREGPAAWDGGWDRPPLAKHLRAALLAMPGVSPAELDGAGAKVIAALRDVFGYARGRWILEVHAEARSELEISAVIDDDVCRLKIDRTFLEGGLRWIIDYKGGGPGRRLAGRIFRLRRQLEKYRPDLERYRQAMAKLDPRPVRLALYFLLSSEFLELTDGRTPPPASCARLTGATLRRTRLVAACSAAP